MGASFFQNSTTAKSMQEAYSELVEEANDEYGHQEGYSGQINCSAGFRDVTSKWKESKLSPNDFITKVSDNMGKHDGAWGICMKEPVGNTNKVKSAVEHSVFKGTRKWNLVYIPRTYYPGWQGKMHDNKADAVKEAREYTEKTGTSTIVKIERVLDKTSGTNVVAKIDYKKSPKEAPGHYVFFGYASC